MVFYLVCFMIVGGVLLFIRIVDDLKLVCISSDIVIFDYVIFNKYICLYFFENIFYLIYKYFFDDKYVII